MRHHNLQVTGSVSVNGISAATAADLATYTGSNDSKVSTLQSFTASVSATNTFTASASSRLNSIETISASNIARISSLEAHSASVDTLNTTQNNRLNSLEVKTGSLATTGSNFFDGTQTITGSLYISADLIVQGTSSIQNITGSAINIGTNIVNLNTATPAVRYAGLTVQDSGSSAGVTGSILWDSLCNRWIYSNPSTVGYSGGIIMSGPRAATFGTETTLTCGYIAKSGGGDHLYDSIMYETGSIVSIAGRICTSGISTNASIVLNESAPINFTGTGGYMYMYSRRAGGSCGAILISNGTGQNLWFGEAGANVYGFGLNPTGTDYSGNLLLNLDILNNRVGIGAMGPLGSLHICTPTAIAYIQSTTGAANAETRYISTTRTWGTGTNIGLGSGGFEIYDVTAGANRLVIDTSGNVGIGRTVPDVKLEVCSASTSSELLVTVKGGANANGQFSAIRVGNGNKFAYVGTLLQPADVAYLHMACNPFTNSCGIYLNESGRVGIGLCQPAAKLDVVVPGTNTQGGCFSASSINIADPTTAGAYSQITFGYSSGRTWAASYIGHVSINSYSGGYGDLVFGTRNCGNDNQPSERLRITGDGKVGINKICPQTTLDVGGPARIASNLVYGVGIAGSSGNNAGIGTIDAANFNIYGNQSCDVVIKTGATWDTSGVASTGTDKLRITCNNSIVGYSQWYSTYVKATCTSDGGSQNVRYIEDALGQWVQVGRFVNNAAIAIQSSWSSVRGLSTSLAQDAVTEFSADWGGSCPSEIRVLGATDFCRWRETRTIDFIYKNIPGRPWCTFFNGGNTDGNYQTTGTVRYGFNTCGTYDGFGRWTNPFNCMIGMSDGAYCNPSSAYTTPTANAFNWNTTQDAKLSAIHYTQYSGQDVNETTGFGVDDAIRGFFDSYPNLTSNMATGDVYSSAVWILLKFN